MKYHDTEAEIADIKRAIETVAKESGVDQRVILCIIVQESGGNVRSITVSGPLPIMPYILKLPRRSCAADFHRKTN